MSQGFTGRVNTGFFPYGMLWGLTLSNSAGDATNDIDIATGSAADVTNVVIMTLGASLTKQLDAAWAVGTNAGGLDTGSIANTTYHVFLIRRSDTGVVDALFSTSATAPTMPTNYDQKRRIGSIVRAAAAIITFVQHGDEFRWKAPKADVAANNPGTAAVTRTLTVPLGIQVTAIIATSGQGTGAAGGPGAIFISDLAITDTAASGSVFSVSNYDEGANVSVAGSTVYCTTNTSGQVRSRIAISDATTNLNISTLGWLDTRGRVD